MQAVLGYTESGHTMLAASSAIEMTSETVQVCKMCTTLLLALAADAILLRRKLSLDSMLQIGS